MHPILDPSRNTTGRGLLLFAVLMLGLGLFVGLVRQAWQDAALWLAAAIFMACYGTIMLGALPQLHRLLLVIGLITGVIAIGLALLASIA
jgi:hypothetical protein